MIISDLNHLEIATENNQVQGGYTSTGGSASASTSARGVVVLSSSSAGSASTLSGSIAGANADQGILLGAGTTYASSSTYYSHNFWW